MSYSEQLKYVQSLGIRAGQHRRVDCPFCNGRNTLSVSNEFGQLLWGCFRASCDVKGVAETTRSVDDIRAALTKRVNSVPKFRLPDYLTSVMSEERARKYLEKFHCQEAYATGRAEIRYDPKTDRVVFIIRDKGEIVDAAGRALKSDQKPKWLRYGSSNQPFVCGSSSTAVVVEDCASACAVSGVATGVALLGTNLQSSFVGMLRSYKKVLICLDPDATGKSLALKSELSYFCRVSVVRLPDDLKYYNAEQVSNLLTPYLETPEDGE